MSATSHSSHRLLLGGLFLAGLALRLHGLNEVSLSHYDEGVYVSSGIRVASQGWYEFAFGQPLHAPPLYPWILSLVYWLLQTPWPPVGCYVSALFGAATLPLFYGLVRPRLSPPHALAAVALLAASDVHIAFSRMALTDVPLTFWFVAAMFGFTRLEAAVRRENPGELVVVAGLTGLAVAAAWNTKYTGWMPPAIASVAAGVHVLLPARRAAESPEHAPEKRSATTMRVVLAGAIVLTLAGLLYLPWYWYVQQHFDGGYAAVTAHHQTYLGTWLQWPGRAAQLLISLPAFRHAGWLLLVVASLILWLWPRRTGDWPGPRACWALLSVLVVLAGGDAVMLCAGAAAIPWAVVRGRWLERLASVWLGSLLVLLPFYFPYVRLITPALPAAAYLAVAGWQALSDASRTRSKSGCPQWARWVPVTAVGTASLAVACATPFRGLPTTALWQRWSSRAAYHAFFWEVEQRTPASAAVICQGQPPFSVYCPRQAVVLGNEPFGNAVEGIPDARPAYLAVDFRVLHEPDRTAWRYFADHLHCLTPVASVDLDVNVAVLLDYMTPQQVAEKLRGDTEAISWRVADRQGRNLVVPPRLDSVGLRDEIVLYQIDLPCLRRPANE